MERRPPAVDRADGDALRRARALAVPTRVSVLDHLRRAERPLTPQELAEVVGVHHTSVRQHLTVLADVGLVGQVPLPPKGRGRPRIAYQPLVDPEPYQHLALILAEAVQQGRTARAAGRVQGAKVQAADRTAIATLLDETARLGFRPRLRPRGPGRHELVLDACPFAAVAAINPSIACDLHLGLAEGILSKIGGMEVVELKVADPHRGGCRFTLRELPST